MCLHDLREVKRFSKPSQILAYRNCSPLSVLGSLSNSGIAPVIARKHTVNISILKQLRQNLLVFSGGKILSSGTGRPCCKKRYKIK